MKTYLTILAQIKKLEKEAEVLKSRERLGVIERIREAVVVYNITQKELNAPSTLSVRKPKAASKNRPAVFPVKYADKAGNTWIGYGHRPPWVKAYIESGKDIKDLRVNVSKTGGKNGST